MGNPLANRIKETKKIQVSWTFPFCLPHPSPSPPLRLCPNYTHSLSTSTCLVSRRLLPGCFIQVWPIGGTGRVLGGWDEGVCSPTPLCLPQVSSDQVPPLETTAQGNGLVTQPCLLPLQVQEQEWLLMVTGPRLHHHPNA